MKTEITKPLNKNQSARLKEVSRERRLQQKENLRQTILRAAAELFVENGYEGFSMRKVAEKIGYSATTIYRYYENKDDVLFAIITDGFREFSNQLKSAAKNVADPVERVEAIGRAYIYFGLKNPVYYQLMFMQRSDLLQQPFEKDGVVTPLQSFTILRQAVESLENRPAISKNPEHYSSVLWALVHGVTSLAINGVPQFSGDLLKKNIDAALEVGIKGLK